MKAVIGKEAAVTHNSQDREIFGHFCGLDNVHVFVSVQKWEESCFCLDPLQTQSECPCRCWWPVKLFMFQGLAEGQASPQMSETAFLFLTSHQGTKEDLFVLYV